MRKELLKLRLGVVEIDSRRTKKIISSNPRILSHKSPFEKDHTLEVHLPFLQTIYKKFKIVPILFGGEAKDLPQMMAKALESVIDDETLIVASSDFSHYPSQNDASRADRETINAILTGSVEKLDETFASLAKEKIPNAITFLCGENGVKTAMLLAAKLGAKEISLLKYSNSGEVTGSQDKAVGYSAIVFTKPVENKEIPLDSEEKKELLRIAKQAVETFVMKKEVSQIKNSLPALEKPLGAFVTLKKSGELRGCGGRFEPDIPLYQVVIQIAISTAAHDPRFTPVTKEELPLLEYEISVLSPLKPVKSADEIEIGKDGVQIIQGSHSGVFLPQVATELNWDKDTFLNTLCSEKAGLPKDCWKNPETHISTFTAQVFSEKEVTRERI